MSNAGNKNILIKICADSFHFYKRINFRLSRTRNSVFGQIAGVLGAYMVLFPRNRVNAVFFYVIVSIPAVFVIGLWGATQMFQGFGSMFETGQSGGVAYMAHIGGFVAGVTMGFIARATFKEEPDSVLRRQYEHDPRAHRLW